MTYFRCLALYHPRRVISPNSAPTSRVTGSKIVRKGKGLVRARSPASLTSTISVFLAVWLVIRAEITTVTTLLRRKWFKTDQFPFLSRASKLVGEMKDLWLKMHTGEGFDRVKGDIVQLLNLYRSASVQVFEDLMRHPDLERFANEHAKRKVCLSLSEADVNTTESLHVVSRMSRKA